MFHVKNHKQLNICDPWEYLGPKRRKELDKSWPGLFRHRILQTLPVDALRKHYHESNGRPSKELYAMLGLMILQQMHDVTDEQAVEQFAFNIKWHYALDITNPSDTYSYVSLRSIWKMRQMLTGENLHETLFAQITKKLAKIFGVDFNNQRIDSVHIQSNMRHLGRISLFCKTIKKFLVNLKRHHRAHFDKLDKKLTARYLVKKEEAVFALVKPSQSPGTLNQIAQDIFTLIERFKAKETVCTMDSFKLLVRLFQEQCILEEHDGAKLVVAKPNKDVPSDSLQNPSDPDAGYSGHKGKGYSVQVMETYNNDEHSKQLNLLTHIDVTSADNSDAHALIPALEKTASQAMPPNEVLADSLYGGDDNVVRAKQRHGVDVLSPLKNPPDGLSLVDFRLDDSGHILLCPQGISPVNVRFKKRFSASFALSDCLTCPQKKQCPVSVGKKAAYYRYTLKDVRLAKRRGYERSLEFMEKYRYRAGVEATMSEYDRVTGVKKLRVRGLAAVTFAAFMKAIGINLKRAGAHIQRLKKAELLILTFLTVILIQRIHVKEQLQGRFCKIGLQLGKIWPGNNFAANYPL